MKRPILRNTPAPHTGACLRTLTSGDVQTISQLAFSPDGSRIAASTIDRDQVAAVRIWETATGADLLSLQHDQLPFRVAFDPTVQYLVREEPEHTVEVRNARSGEPVGIIGCHDRQIWCIIFSPDRRLLATASTDGRWLASGGEDTTIRIWEAISWELRHTLRGHTGWISSLAFSRDSARLASGSRDRTVKIWDSKRQKAKQKEPS